jgi:hypothetical protein
MEFSQFPLVECGRTHLLQVLAGWAQHLDPSRRTAAQVVWEYVWHGRGPVCVWPVAVLENCIGFIQAFGQGVAKQNLSLRGVERRSNLKFGQLEIASGPRPRNDNLPISSRIKTSSTFENPYSLGRASFSYRGCEPHRPGLRAVLRSGRVSLNNNWPPAEDSPARLLFSPDPPAR